MGVTYGIFTKDKNNLLPGTSYRGQARTWCDPVGGAYRSSYWTPLVFWTQPTSIRISNTDMKERQLVKITDLLGREVNPEKVINNTTLFYIYSDGTVEKRIVIESFPILKNNFSFLFLKRILFCIFFKYIICCS